MAGKQQERQRSLTSEILTGTLLLFGPIALAIAFIPFNTWFTSSLNITSPPVLSSPVPTTTPILVLPDDEAQPVDVQQTPAAQPTFQPTAQPTVPASPTSAPTPIAPTPPPLERSTPLVANTPEPDPGPNLEVQLPPGAETAFETLDEAETSNDGVAGQADG